MKWEVKATLDSSVVVDGQIICFDDILFYDHIGESMSTAREQSQCKGPEALRGLPVSHAYFKRCPCVSTKNVKGLVFEAHGLDSINDPQRLCHLLSHWVSVINWASHVARHNSRALRVMLALYQVEITDWLIMISKKLILITSDTSWLKYDTNKWYELLNIT